MNIIEDKQNNFLSRRELKFSVNAEKTPSLDEARKMIADESKKEEELIVIDRIKGKFGMKEFIVESKIYDTKEKREEIEPRKKVKGGAAEAAKKA